MTRQADSKAPSSEGDQPLSMTRLVEDNLQRLYAFAFRLSGSANEAEELTQQTFLVAQQKIDQLRDADRVEAWLLRILRNMFLKNVRKHKPKLASQIELNLNEVFVEPPPESQWDQERLQMALGTLPDEYRAVVLMFYFEDRSYRDIAAELDVPPGTVMSRLARAKQQLRRKLNLVHESSPTRAVTGLRHPS